MAGSARTISFALLIAAVALAQDFVSGDECLFCHRFTTGTAWQANPHNRTVRPKSEGSDEWLIGRGRNTAPKAIRKAGFGKFSFPQGGDAFSERCSRCHNTAVDPKTLTFALPAIDCYACHGSVDLKHSGDTSLVLFSKKRRPEAAETNRICGACHLRGSEPDPNPVDRHVFRAVREGQSCLACHAVHARSTDRHRRVLSSASCLDCHVEGKPRKELIPSRVLSRVCGY